MASALGPSTALWRGCDLDTRGKVEKRNISSVGSAFSCPEIARYDV